MLAEIPPWGVVTAITALGVAFITGVVTLIQFFVKRHDEGSLLRAQRKCSHWFPTELDDGNIGVTSLFTMPSGQRDWVCSACHLTTPDQRMAKYWVQESVNEAMRKIGRRGKRGG